MKKERGVKNFFGEFKKFITRGNVLDMAVGVIVGGAFTGIVNGLSNFILKPIINWLLALILKGDGLAGAVTFLQKVTTTDEAGVATVDMVNSIYIDWGSFISAIINFILIAFTLFLIVRTINRISENKEKAFGKYSGNDKKEIKKIRKEEKVSYKEARKLYEARLAAAKAEEEKLAAEKAAAAAAAEEAKAMANTKLLEEIRDLLKAGR